MAEREEMIAAGEVDDGGTRERKNCPHTHTKKQKPWRRMIPHSAGAEGEGESLLYITAAKLFGGGSWSLLPFHHHHHLCSRPR